MSPSPLDKKPNDLGVRYIAPSGPTDPRVPTAEESSLGSDILIEALRRSRLDTGWVTLPKLAVSAPRKLLISQGQALLPIYPGVLSIETQIDLPALPGLTNVVKQEDLVYLVAFSAEVGAAQDMVLGQYTFQYRDQSTQQITTIQKENARRVRAFWLLVQTSSLITAAAVLNALTLESNGDRRLTISDTSDAGFSLSGMRFYAKDASLTQGATYTVVTGSIELIELCRVRRLQNYTERGYTWGFGGEAPLAQGFNVVNSATAINGGDINTNIRRRLLQIFEGNPGPSSGLLRTIQNLTSGAVSGNPGNPGESAGSPNNSVCLANDQRTTFTNQAITQRTSVQIITAGNDGNGNALVPATLNTNVPAGTFFSARREDHKIYAANGTEQSALGTFTNLGGTGTLIWIAEANSSIRPGTQVYFVPAINFSAGSGFSIPFRGIDKVWLGGAALSAANLLRGETQDLTAYTDPANNENFFVVVGRERAAIHYIYHRTLITTDSSGTATIPNTARGCFAFINGVAGRLDSPVKTGLTPGTEYKALVYYPPRSLESWQFLCSYPEYQGTGLTEPTFLDGATILSTPVFFCHTQGGGLSVFQGDASLRFSPISMLLPDVSSDIPSYVYNAPIQLIGEPYPGPITFRELPPTSGAGLALPAPGQVITLTPQAGIQPRSINGALAVNGQPLGFRTPLLSSKTPFQAVMAFAVKKGAEVRLVVVTRSGFGGENVLLDSTQQTAIDTFKL